MPFENILGHGREIGILRGALSSGRLAHAFLFAGPEGVGKRLVALDLARALNCDGEGCGSCRDCVLVQNGTHPNMINVWPTVKVKENEFVNALDGDGLIRIHQVREVQNALRYRVERGRKVVVVDYADRLMPAAANAFLKTLEEPPEGSVIILISSRPADLLPTILSRCQRINFRPLPVEAIASWLSENKGIAPSEGSAIAKLSCGSIARALKHLGEGAHETRGEIIKKMMALDPDDAGAALNLAEELSKRDDLDEVLEFLMIWFRDRLAFAEGEERLMVNGDMAGYAASGSRDPRRLADGFTMIDRARRDIMPPRYANKQLTMESLLLRIAGI